MYFPIALLAVSLSLDALGVGVAYGMRKIKIPIGSKLVICLFSILYSAGALALGSSLSSVLPDYASKAIGIIILVGMGSWIIIQALFKKEENKAVEERTTPEDETIFQWGIKSLGITIQVIKNPVYGDIDKSGVIDTGESFLLGLALSIDAIGVGVGSALSGFNSMLIPPAVGLFQMVFLYSGTFLGEKFSSAGKLNPKVVSVLPGILLIFLAVLRIY